MTSDVKEVMTIEDAARYLQISKDSLYGYAAEGKVPAFKLGKRWRFSRSLLDAWMEAESHKCVESKKI